ncbi:unnamed protein product [Adineta ricciae]|nr:unnamed protein product [Adineta ricciae]
MNSDQSSKIVLDSCHSEDLQRDLAQDHYAKEIDSVLKRPVFNIVIMGPPRVGKSSLINAMCNDASLAEVGNSLDSCTKEMKKYELKCHKFQIEGFPPIEINIFDTPGVESWEDGDAENRFLEFIGKTNPICVFFCAAPGSFAKLPSLRKLLEYCKQRKIICALICTNMWSGKNRKKVIEELKNELKIFGDEREEQFHQVGSCTTHSVTFFGNGALCTAVNTAEYIDKDLGIQKPVQGVDELIESVMTLLDNTKLLGWCLTVLQNRNYSTIISQKVYGFLQLRFAELQSVRDMSASEIGKDILVLAVNTYLNSMRM